MAQRFTSLDEAAEQLDISKERLNELREANKVRAYRDGASWKFRSEDIERLASAGIDPPSSSDLDLGNSDETLRAGYAGDVGIEHDELELGDLQLDDAPLAQGAEASDPHLANIDEPTTPVGPEASESEELDLELDEGDDAESILLSDADFSDPHGRPPSTIIGKVELDRDADLELAPGSSARNVGDSESDVRLADEGDDVLSSGVLDTGASPSAKFEDLAELEIDLEAESSRILTPSDVKSAQSAAQQKQKAPQSDLQLDDDDSTPARSGAGLTGISSIDVSADRPASGPSASSMSPLEMESADDDDFVLGGEGSGSDITLSSADSGINLSPSDSGLALDEVSLDLGGSAMGSSLDLSEALAASRSGSLAGLSELGGAEDFQLTPLTEAAAEDEEEDSSQIIALEEVAEEPAAEELLGPSVFTETPGAVAMTSPGGYATAAEPRLEWWVYGLLACCMIVLVLSGMMMIDLMRNMWSWQQPFSLNSGLIDGILGLLGGG